MSIYTNPEVIAEINKLTNAGSTSGSAAKPTTVVVTAPAASTSTTTATAASMNEIKEQARHNVEIAAVKKAAEFKEVPNTAQYINGFATSVTEIELGENTSGIAEGSIVANFENQIAIKFPEGDPKRHALGISTTLSIRGFGGSKKDFQISYNKQLLKLNDLGFGFNPGPYTPTLTRICRVYALDIFRILILQPGIKTKMVFWQKLQGHWKFEDDYVFCYIGSLSLLPKLDLPREIRIRCAAVNAVLALANANRQAKTNFKDIPINKWNAFVRVSGLTIEEISAYLKKGLLKVPSGAEMTTEEFAEMMTTAQKTAKVDTDAGYGPITMQSAGFGDGKGKQKE